MTQPLLSLRSVSKIFKLGTREVRAVHDVYFDVTEGECLAVVGESGSGKSTIANMVLGIYPQTLGEIVYRGNVLPARRDLAHRRAIKPPRHLADPALERIAQTRRPSCQCIRL